MHNMYIYVHNIYVHMKQELVTFDGAKFMIFWYMYKPPPCKLLIGLREDKSRLP